MPTVQDLLATFIQFANLPDSQRETFLRQHPEIQNASVVGSVMMSAKLRDEPEFKRRVGSAALYVATKLNDTGLQAEARKLLAGA